MFQGIDHVVVAVPDLQKGVEQYEAIFGRPITRTDEPAGAGFKMAIFDFGQNLVELITPTNDSGPVAKFVQRSGGGLYLLAMRVDDLSATVAALRDKGIRLVGDPGPGKPVTGQVFIHPSSAGGVLVQLLAR